MARELILVVDDDADHLAALGRSLRLAGYTVTLARDGESALEEVGKVRPALVLSDVLMPGLNGFQTCRKLKENPATKELPVILMSAKTDPADHFWASEVGALVLVPKPIDMPQLIERIAAALKPGASG
jgi:formate hydrogenlyase transcriptional activator